MNKTFKGHNGYQGQYVTAQEEMQAWTEDQAQDAEMEESRKENCVLEWDASNGQHIEIWVFDPDDITVKTGSFSRDEHRVEGFRAIPVAQQARAKAMGIVCQLGPVALTAERKAVVEAAIRKFQK